MFVRDQHRVTGRRVGWVHRSENHSDKARRITVTEVRVNLQRRRRPQDEPVAAQIPDGDAGGVEPFDVADEPILPRRVYHPRLS